MKGPAEVEIKTYKSKCTIFLEKIKEKPHFLPGNDLSSGPLRTILVLSGADLAQLARAVDL